MNYIELVNQFWRSDIEHSFTGNESKLYFFLLHISNTLNWKNPFRLSYRQIELGSGLTVNTIKTARNRLKQAGLINFTPGRQGNAKNILNKATYELRLSKPDNQPANRTHNQNVNPAANRTDRVTKLKTDQTKENSLFPETNIPETIKKTITIPSDLNFVPSDDWRALIREWLEYKAERKEGYKSEKTIKAFATQLWNLSQRNLTTAQAILRQSYACNYAGIFPIKNNSYANTTNSCNRKMPNLRQSDFD